MSKHNIYGSIPNHGLNSLVPPDTHYLAAAEGWLGLGNHVEAADELEKITPALRAHPDVLEVRLAVYYTAKNWNRCFEIGSALVHLAPERASGWRHRSACLHFMNRTRKAYDLLRPALEKFPYDWPIQYDMACYACVLGEIEEARARLAKAFALVDAKSIRLAALNDPDLEPFWTEIKAL